MPEELHVHHFLPARPTCERPVCLDEAPSVEELRDHLDRALGESSTRNYFPVGEQQAMGIFRGVSKCDGEGSAPPRS